MGACGQDRGNLPEVFAQRRQFFPNADPFRRRAHDRVLPLREVRTSMERKLVFLAILLLLLVSAVHAQEFSVVLYMCVWKRPLLTAFVLRHYTDMRNELKRDGIHLHVFIAGSDAAQTKAQANTYNADYIVVPNRPLGTKHNRGLQAIRDRYHGSTPPDAVVVSGSDDVLNAQFFRVIRGKMSGPFPQHIVGLADVHFFDLNSTRLVHTAGYRVSRTPLAATVGCGRAFSWFMLETLKWELWDWDRDRSLDASSMRRILRAVPQIAEISTAVNGLQEGVIAVDVKTDAFEKGANIWRFDQIIAGAKSGPLHEFVDRDARFTLNQALGESFFEDQIMDLRKRMAAGQESF